MPPRTPTAAAAPALLRPLMRPRAVFPSGRPCTCGGSGAGAVRMLRHEALGPATLTAAAMSSPRTRVHRKPLASLAPDSAAAISSSPSDSLPAAATSGVQPPFADFAHPDRPSPVRESPPSSEQWSHTLRRAAAAQPFQATNEAVPFLPNVIQHPEPPPIPFPSVIKDIGVNKQPSAHLGSATEPNSSVVQPAVTFYRRHLPESLISLHSPEGRRLLKESLAAGSAEAFLQLSGNLAHQSEPAFCALGSLAIVLNALEVDPQRPWKGVWRWYDETLLDCSPPLDEVRRKGLTFGEFACLARCNNLDVVARQGSSVSREQFAADLREVARGGGAGAVQMVVSFSRKALGQTGDGHFSPVGAYHEAEDKVLVLDVARFKYPSYFVATDLLYESMKPVDKETGVSRGYFLLRQAADDHAIPLVHITPPSSRPLKQQLFRDLPQSLRSLGSDSAGGLDAVVRHVIRTTLRFAADPAASTSAPPPIVAAAPDRVAIGFRAPGVDLAAGPAAATSLERGRRADVDSLVTAARRCAPALWRAALPAVTDAAAATTPMMPGPAARERATALAVLFLAALPEQVAVAVGDEAARREFGLARRAVAASPQLQHEVERLAVQLQSLANSFCKCGKSQCKKMMS